MLLLEGGWFGCDRGWIVALNRRERCRGGGDAPDGWWERPERLLEIAILRRQHVIVPRTRNVGHLVVGPEKVEDRVIVRARRLAKGPLLIGEPGAHIVVERMERLWIAAVTGKAHEAKPLVLQVIGLVAKDLVCPVRAALGRFSERRQGCQVIFELAANKVLVARQVLVDALEGEDATKLLFRRQPAGAGEHPPQLEPTAAVHRDDDPAGFEPLGQLSAAGELAENLVDESVGGETAEARVVLAAYLDCLADRHDRDHPGARPRLQEGGHLSRHFQQGLGIQWTGVILRVLTELPVQMQEYGHLLPGGGGGQPVGDQGNRLSAFLARLQLEAAQSADGDRIDFGLGGSLFLGWRRRLGRCCRRGLRYRGADALDDVRRPTGAGGRFDRLRDRGVAGQPLKRQHHSNLLTLLRGACAPSCPGPRGRLCQETADHSKTWVCQRVSLPSFSRKSEPSPPSF